MCKAIAAFYALAHYLALLLAVAWGLIANGASPIVRTWLVDIMWAAYNGAQPIPILFVWMAIFSLSVGWGINTHMKAMMRLYSLAGFLGEDHRSNYGFPRRRPYNRRLKLSLAGMGVSFLELLWITWGTPFLLLPFASGALAVLAFRIYRKWGVKQWWSGISTWVLIEHRQKYATLRARAWWWEASC